jgi:MFS family permease
MTIPVYILGAICLVTNCYLSDRFMRRAPFLVGCCFPVMIGYLICVGTPNTGAGLAGMFILVIGKAAFPTKSSMTPALTPDRTL